MDKKDKIMAAIGIAGVIAWVVSIYIMFFPFLG